MFSQREFIRKGFILAVGSMPDYQIVLNAAGWYEKGVLTIEDLSDIQGIIDTKNVDIVEVEQLEEDIINEWPEGIATNE